MAEGGLKFAQPAAQAGQGADQLMADLAPEDQARITEIDAQLRQMRERREANARLLAEMDREIAKYEPDPGDRIMRENMRQRAQRPAHHIGDGCRPRLRLHP